MFSVAAQSVNPIIDSNTPQKQSSMNYKKNSNNSNIMYSHFHVDFANNRLFILSPVNPNKCLDTDEQHYDLGVFS